MCAKVISRSEQTDKLECTGRECLLRRPMEEYVLQDGLLTTEAPFVGLPDALDFEV